MRRSAIGENRPIGQLGTKALKPTEYTRRRIV